MNTIPETLQTWWDDYRRNLTRRNIKPATVQLYQDTFATFWKWAQADGVKPDPAAVTHKVINRWVDHLIASPVIRNGKALTTTDRDTGEEVARTLEPGTVAIMYRSLRPFFSWYAREEEAPNPFDRADPPRVPVKPVPLVPVEDVQAVLAQCDSRSFADLRDGAIVRILFDIGLRRGEVVSLVQDSFDRTHDTLTVVGKTGQRTLPLSPTTAEALARYLRARARHRHAELPALWLAPRGKLGDTGLAQLIKRRCEMAGVAPMHPHQLRHTFAHLYRMNGGSEGDLMYLMGWSTPAMAHRYGASAAAERANAAARRIQIGELL